MFRVRTEVVAIDRQAKQVKVRELDTGREYEQPYDALVLAPGASPHKPPLPGINREGHFVLARYSRCGSDHGLE